MLFSFFLFFCTSYHVALATSPPDTVVAFVHPITHLVTDEQCFLYATDETGALFQLDSNLNVLKSYSSLQQRSITSLEIDNAFQLLIYQKELNQLCFLNRFLTNEQCIFLDFKKFSNISLLTRSSDFLLWIYDNTTFTIKKINTQNNQVLNVFSLENLIENDEEVIDLKEKNNILFVLLSNGNVLLFNQYGSYLNKIKNINENKLVFAKENIIYNLNNNIVKINYLDNFQENILLEIDFKDNFYTFCILNNNLFLTYKNKIKRYKLY